MPILPAQLAGILDRIEQPGNFYAAGVAEIHTPSLTVEGIGPVALPLLPMQAEQLVAVAERAPYGKGKETLVDTEVRRTWQIGADKVRIAGKHWQKNLDGIVAQVANKLGVNGTVIAELYKLLVYDTGSFFVSHRDTEKTAGMFATLVIILPSVYSGGELVVRHRGEEARLELNVSDPSEVAYAAFYADCKHEVLPITSGCRLTLIYNLLRTDQNQASEPPDYGSEQADITDWLREWGQSLEAEESDAPQKLIYLLEHAYTQAELSFAALKGTDASRGIVAAAAAEQADCDLHLGLLTIHEYGSAEHAYYPSRRGRYREYEDNEEFEIGEVIDRFQKLSNWRKPDDSRPAFAEIPFENEEVCLPEGETLEPEEVEFSEATGNEGASYERTYQRAALVFWPRRRRLAVFNQAGLSITRPYLNDLAERWVRSGKGFESPLWQEAHELSGHILRTWSQSNQTYRHLETSGDRASILNSLFRLQDKVRIDAFLSKISAEGNYGMGDNENLVLAIGLLPPSRAIELIECIVAKRAAIDPAACADLLARCSLAAWSGVPPSSLFSSAKSLVDVLPGDPQTPPPTNYRSRQALTDPLFVVNLMAALERISPGDLAEQAADCLLTRSATYGLDAILVPALLKLSGQTGAATGRLRTACLEHLGQRIAKTLEPPADWTRANTLSCKCKHCAELGRFLVDPGLKEWFFKASQHDRSHVEHSIKQAACDIDMKTDTRGRPYTLVCVKNQASYEKRVRQCEQDLRNREALAQLTN